MYQRQLKATAELCATFGSRGEFFDFRSADTSTRWKFLVPSVREAKICRRVTDTQPPIGNVIWQIKHDSTSAEWSTKRERKLKDARRTVRWALVGGGWPAHLA